MSSKFVVLREDPEIIEEIDRLAKADGTDRSGFIRALIRRELGRRAPRSLSTIQNLLQVLNESKELMAKLTGGTDWPIEGGP